MGLDMFLDATMYLSDVQDEEEGGDQWTDNALESATL